MINSNNNSDNIFDKGSKLIRDFCENFSNIINNQLFSNSYKNNELFGKIKRVLKSEYGIELVTCPAGSFYMGSKDGEIGKKFTKELLVDTGISNNFLRVDNKEFYHKVTLTKDFMIGKFPITECQYKSITGKNPSEKIRGVSEKDSANCPVNNISFLMAKAFCDNLNKKLEEYLPDGYMISLPTEAQWEYACRAGTNTSLNNNTNLKSETVCSNLDKVGWYQYNSSGRTHSVGLKSPNNWGIYDMHGNVSEWCLDLYDRDSEDYPHQDAVDPCFLEGRPDLTTKKYTRVHRGGSFLAIAFACRSADRGYLNEDLFFSNNGFRLAIIPKINI